MDVQAIRRIVEGLLSSLAVPRLRWAEVTQTSPLRIAYVNEDPLPFAPTVLGKSPALSDPVLTIQWGTQVVILGSKGVSADSPVALGSGVNLNTLTDWKTYTQGNNASAATGFNYPVAVAGVLEVIPIAGGGTGHVWQRYTTYRHTTPTGGDQVGPTVYVRAWGSGSWSPWRQLISEDEVGGVVSSKTYYVKKPNGELICRGSHSFPASANNNQSYAWTFPVAFVGEFPHVSPTADTTVPQNVSMGISNLTLTSVNIQFLRTTSSATGTWFEARGRWK